MALTAIDLLDYAYYRCTPVIYREQDAKLDFPLYRYLASIILGGYSLSITDIENLLQLVDPEKCPDEFFPLLYESFGLEYYPDVEIKYHRKLLMNYGELRRRRGTYSCIRFLVKVLTSMDVKLRYLRGVYNEENGRHLIITLQAATIEDVINLENDSALIQKFLGLFLPYYITTTVESEVATQEVLTKVYRANVISSFASYTIRPRSTT